MCMHISQDHPIITLSVPITGRVSTVVRVSKEPKQVLVELSHLKGLKTSGTYGKSFHWFLGSKNQ